jgi:hypothetical protein
MLMFYTYGCCIILSKDYACEDGAIQYVDWLLACYCLVVMKSVDFVYDL